ncbi:MAG TPA: DUF192 domain-containing protein [Rhodanobacteraceae bacterium]|nr:DUF192 domain-containing protein [Rhodanobacteraceae bacterium]
MKRAFVTHVRPVYWLYLPILAAALASAACAAMSPPAFDTPTVTLRGHAFSVEVAATPAQWGHGLMNRTSMPGNHGMLFVYPEAQPLSFWMKDTLIPLDMLFFDDRHRLVTIQGDVPPCRTTTCPSYLSGVTARYVLELNAGMAAKLGLRKGDVITFSSLPSGTQ